MYFHSKKPEECYGCKACLNACHQSAISFRIMNDTYPYPKIDRELCVNCGACIQVCPYQDVELKEPDICFAAVTKNFDDWERSSSGGAFKVLASAAWELSKEANNNFYLCACDWDSSLNARHKVEPISEMSQIEQFCKSKYVISDTRNVYAEIKSLLKDNNNKVMFVGTPCQVSGLKMIMHGQKGVDNLICIDLICHGAPGQKIFDKYLAGIELSEGSKICKYTFKNKHKLENGTIYTRSAKIEFEDGHSKMVTRLNDDYLSMFYTMSYHCRPSCNTCKFHNSTRVGDITIGDAWNIDKKYPELNPLHGVSLILFNTKLSKSFIPYVKNNMDIYDCKYDFVVRNNSGLRPRSVNLIPHDIITSFFTSIMNNSKTFSQCVNEYKNAINEFLNNKQ